MIKLGFCGSINQAAMVRDWGFDYIELALAPLANMPEDDFAAELDKLKESALPCLACNCFLAQPNKVVGDNADPSANELYVRTALSRAARLGAKIVVFGSSGSRNIPGGFSGCLALRQLQDFSSMAAAIAADHGITLVLEPLNAAESNIINLVSEAHIMVQAVDHPNFKVLADYYHMLREHENLTALDLVGEDLRHVHTATLLGRKIPTMNDQMQQSLLVKALHGIGYSGNLSIEAGSREDLAAEAQAAQKMFRKLLTVTTI